MKVHGVEGRQRRSRRLPLIILRPDALRPSGKPRAPELIQEGQMAATMWNQFDTGGHDGMTAEVIDIKGFNGDTVNAYYVRPSGPGPFPGIVLVHHLPGW